MSRKPYNTTRRFPTKHKTTTEQGKLEYQRLLMRERRAAQKKEMQKLCKTVDLSKALGMDQLKKATR